MLRRTICVVLFLASPAMAANYHVDARNGSDAQNGLSWGAALLTVTRALELANATPETDTIQVAEGTYLENLFVPSGVALEGGFPPGGGTRDPLAHPTILDGGGTDSVVIIGPGATGVSVDGFRITNGDGTVSGGGGIYADTSQVSITNNVITGNTVSIDTARGGGIALYGPSPGTTANVISGNTIQGNSTQNGNGGGIAVMEFNTPIGPAVQLTGNRIEGNTARGSQQNLGRGGGVYILANDALLLDNDILGNQAIAQGNASQAGNGGGILIVQANPVLTRNTIRANVAQGGRGNYGGSGGGVCAYDFSGEISSNTISANQATGGGGQASAFGGGIFLLAGSPAITGNTIEGNLLEGTGCLNGRGGGVYLSEADATLTGNRIASNRNHKAGSAGDGPCWDDPGNCHCFLGGGFWSYQSGTGPLLRENLFEANFAGDGGGLTITGTGTARLEHNRIRRNEASRLDGAGMEVFWSDVTLFNSEIVRNVGDGLVAIGDPTDPATLTLRNVTIAENGLNCPGPNPTCGIGLYTWYANGLDVRNSIIYGDGLSDWVDWPDPNNNPTTTIWTFAYTDFGDRLLPGAGNIAVNPLFTPGPLGDHYLSSLGTGQGADSPCLDASADPATGSGLETRTTLLDGTPDGGPLDMGFHYPSTTPGTQGWIWRMEKVGADLTVRFTRVTGADGHRIYRGTLPLDPDGNHAPDYSHETPFTTSQAECFVATPASFVTLTGELSSPGDYYYLVVPVTGGVEGVFGERDLDGDGIGDGERTRPEDSGTDPVRNNCP